MGLLKIIFFVIFAIEHASSSGYMQIRLKSDQRQNATVIVSEGANPTYIVLPIALQNGKIRDLGVFPVTFGQNYKLTIHGGKVEGLGINGSTYRAHFDAIQGRLAPKEIHLPLNGLEILFKCDENWSGTHCDVPCSDSDCDSSSKAEDGCLTVSADYSLDLEKLPEIVERLKTTTKVENDIREKEQVELKRRIQEDDNDVVAIKPKSMFEGLFKDVFNRVLNEDSDRESNRKPFFDVKMSRKSHEEPKSESFLDTIMSGMDGIEKHRSSQESLRFEHSKPSIFSRPRLEMEGMPMFGGLGSLMRLLPRVARETVTEASGEPLGDFLADQIIN